MAVNGKKIKSIAEDREFISRYSIVFNANIPDDSLRLRENGLLECSEPMYSRLVAKRMELDEAIKKQAMKEVFI